MVADRGSDVSAVGAPLERTCTAVALKCAAR